MDARDFKDYKSGEFLEVFNPKFKIWVLCQIVTNYGIIKQGDEYKWGYKLEVIREDLAKKLSKKYKIDIDSPWCITEDISTKWWREAPPAAKVLYGGRKPRTEVPDDYPFGDYDGDHTP